MSTFLGMFFACVELPQDLVTYFQNSPTKVSDEGKYLDLSSLNC